MAVGSLSCWFQSECNDDENCRCLFFFSFWPRLGFYQSSWLSFSHLCCRLGDHGDLRELPKTTWNASGWPVAGIQTSSSSDSLTVPSASYLSLVWGWSALASEHSQMLNLLICTCLFSMCPERCIENFPAIQRRNIHSLSVHLDTHAEGHIAGQFET